MPDVHELMAELYNLRYSNGIPWEDIDAFIDVDLYAGSIMGYASQYLKGIPIDPDKIKIDEQLSQRLENAIAVLTEMRAFKQRHDELVKQLMEAFKDRA